MKTNKTAYRSAGGIVLAAAFILLLPLLAMQMTDEVVWTLSDFVVAGALLLGTGLMYQLAARKGDNIAYRAAVGVAVLAVLLLAWLSLAVGIIGVEGDPADLMYIGVIAVLIIGAIIARFQPHAMARALFATALAQALVVVIALIAGKQHSPISSVTEIVGVNAIFIALFLGSAWLFRYSAREQPPAPQSTARIDSRPNLSERRNPAYGSYQKASSSRSRTSRRLYSAILRTRSSGRDLL